MDYDSIAVMFLDGDINASIGLSYCECSSNNENSKMHETVGCAILWKQWNGDGMYT